MSVMHGLYEDLDEQKYHAHPTSLSVTGAKLLLKAPALYAYRRKNPEQRAVFDFGKAAHAKVLGVGAEIVVVDADSWRTKAAQEARDAARAEGKAPLLPADAAKVDAMAEELAKIPLVRDLMANGRPEVSAFCEDEATGVLRRSRFDLLDDLLIDYKTTVCAEPGAFGRSAGTYGYHQQHAWYEDIARDLGQKVRGFLFVAQEKEPPYLASVCELVPEAVARGAELNTRALQIFRDCTEAGVWPGYATGITPIDIPRYAYYDMEHDQ